MISSKVEIETKETAMRIWKENSFIFMNIQLLMQRRVLHNLNKSIKRFQNKHHSVSNKVSNRHL